MEKYEVIGFLLNKGFQVTPDAADYFVKMTNSNFGDLVKKIVGKKNVKNNTNFNKMSNITMNNYRLKIFYKFFAN